MAAILSWPQCVNSLRLGDEYVSLNRVIIGSGNGLLHVMPQAITWTTVDVLLIGLSSRGNFKGIFLRNSNISNKFQNVISKMAAKFHVWGWHFAGNYRLESPGNTFNVRQHTHNTNLIGYVSYICCYYLMWFCCIRLYLLLYCIYRDIFTSRHH